MKIGKAKYSLVLAESGGIVDDVIVYRTGEQSFLVISNAGNRDAVASAFDLARRTFPEAPLVDDVTDDYALIALQGPEARGILSSTPGVQITGTALDELGYYAWTEGTFEGAPLFVARTGYTGEDGYELMIPTAQAAALWDAALAAGAAHGLVPCGLAARDTLRLEAGMPLYGHELSRDIVPAQAGLGRVVAADKEAFVGKDGLSSGPPTPPCSSVSSLRGVARVAPATPCCTGTRPSAKSPAGPSAPPSATPSRWLSSPPRHPNPEPN